jgi:hypothetical protein
MPPHAKLSQADTFFRYQVDLRVRKRRGCAQPQDCAESNTEAAMAKREKG